MSLVPIILCGGAGSRLWPVSRELHPKPFIRLSDGQSLLQKAFLRAAALPGVAEILTVTNRELFFKTEDEFRAVNEQHCATSYILEPLGRNTAAAVAAASLRVAQTHGDDTVMLVLAADHLIADQDAFRDAVQQAEALAREGRIVTFGIHPESPETGYGYIEADGNKVLRFVEKPSLEKAREYLASQRFLWNSGMFCFTAGAMLRELKEHAPDILEATEASLARSRVATAKGWTQVELESESFAAVPEDSIDYAVMEKCTRAAVVPCSIGWSDIGSWAALSELSKADDKGNRVEGEALLHDVSDCYLVSRDRLIGAVGVEGLIVIDTPDALLIANRERAQDVKHVFAKLKAQGHEAHRLHRTVHRPWGTYTVLEEGPRFKIKRIEVKPGASLSLQMHHHRSEHWIVVSGMAKVVNGDKEFFVAINESTYIPAGHKHRLENPGVVDLVMIEVQSGEYLGEDDIVRFEDIYGRA
ncbi:mannose-1-phosphate guanylyltransferase/mannose-6-phosphate isomerase [Cupriavidus gilardii]|uniref:mannose-1-phosphate guanylyltransferase n=1 Tax=Cupriavidus gilardii TaxID=82541 RepID=A0ABY4VRH9_9BURK|nr:mannose-1-phosphate guanylyltransferase/mannose-6-phosphate isomerase [Cupriavidus gilardii]QQE07352.1 mannose-1-phosphate guanylyltransferase/mannose-6-phosphate isomerase [Cupriavidus sp. ISTL7]MCT9015955.1 mannose-1-phosphate guanylyltransferase/mannose-6-phosphate isomerase [Cupriavidus gilardii]MCT9055725.1 mannose-1-phosphate guanylyltransferase/mannose-6-phosphate isomerase [Cupriavidus gilardii]MCT9070996.1 mannose-1-phosphate guanylyltransferase/mannose-6-phosphate isomerase [Cupria